jgi:hypothetical protein
MKHKMLFDVTLYLCAVVPARAQSTQPPVEGQVCRLQKLHLRRAIRSPLSTSREFQAGLQKSVPPTTLCSEQHLGLTARTAV